MPPQLTPIPRPLRILLLCTSDLGGGAAESARRQLEALSARGLEVRMLVLHKHLPDERIASVATTLPHKLRAKAAFLAERLEIYLRNGRSRRQLFRFSSARWGMDLAQHPWVQEADVLHLHWINQGFLSLGGLRQLAALGKPIFATLHDLWMATGGCHLPLTFDRLGASPCPRYELGCGCCPLLHSEQTKDFSRERLQAKRFLAQPPFRYIAVSSVEARLFSQGELMRSALHPLVLPNPIDAELFSPETVRLEGKPAWYQEGRYYLTLVAARLDEEVKGPELLKAIAAELQARHPELAALATFVLVGGMRAPKAFEDLALPYLTLGSIRERRTLASIYGHSDLLLSTSLYETFGQTLVEALAVGTPVVSFRSGGPEDILQDGRNGRLISAFDTTDYADAIASILEQRRLGAGYSPELCRESIQPFTAEAVAEGLHSAYLASLA